MEAPGREELFRKYVQWLERRLEGEEVGGRGREAELLREAAALLGTRPSEVGQCFRLLPFYRVAENALRATRGSSLASLETAFCTLEMVCANLLLFPWKKEFRCIKTFTGPYVYQLKSVLCETDLRFLLRSMGYVWDQELRFQAAETPGGTARLQQLAFELFLARAECRLLGEVAARGGSRATEALEARRRGRECKEAEPRWREGPAVESQRGGRGFLRRSSRSSRSVDVTDSSGSWQPCARPVLRATLSLRKEPRLLDEDVSPATGSSYFPTRTPPPAEPFSPQLGFLDELDLYSDRGAPPPTRRTPPPLPRPRDGWQPKSHWSRCPVCNRWGPQCDGMPCSSCRAEESARGAAPDCPKPLARPLDGFLLAKEKLSVYSGPRPAPANGSRCSFCNKPASTYTCMSCSKLSCCSCQALYSSDPCGRKGQQHSFTPNHQLNYKPSVLSQLVYR